MLFSYYPFCCMILNMKGLRKVFGYSLFLSSLFFFVFCFSGCSDKDSEDEQFDVINLDGTFSWAYAYFVEPENESDLEFISALNEFKPLDTSKRNNLSDLVGSVGSYVWLKTEFEIPENLKDINLGLVIPYLHFSDTLFLNGKYIWRYGSFPPNYQSAQYQSQYFYLPKEYLNRDGKNMILIKVFCLGKATLSNNVIITEEETAETISNNRTFLTSRIYMFFEGGLFCSLLLFLMMYFFAKNKQKNSQYLDFAIVNLATMFLLTSFFAPEVPWYANYDIPYITFIKLTLCIPSFIIAYFVTSFVVHFLNYRETRIMRYLRQIFLLLPILIILFMKDYVQLMRICPYMVIFLVMHFFIVFVYMTFAFIRDKKHTKCHIITICYSPFIATIVADLIIRLGFNNLLLPYFSLFGWQLTIIGFIVVLTRDFNSLAIKIDYLNENLKAEVTKKTEIISEANHKLEQEIRHSNLDLKMAAKVQQKLLPKTIAYFKGWQIAVAYKPLNIVSGDLYDFYHTDSGEIKGLSLFDVSGHGLGSGLITMLVKNLISKNFEISYEKSEALSFTLDKINRAFCEEKGSVDNYLTGVLVKFSPISQTDECNVSLVRASHPNPILFDSFTGEVRKIGPENSDLQYGAIGLSELPVSSVQSDFIMKRSDILLLYTDGLTESINQNFEPFGIERVEKLLVENKSKTATQIRDTIISELEKFCGEAGLFDDLSLIVLKRDDVNNYFGEN